jgi:hypothetical protein
MRLDEHQPAISGEALRRSEGNKSQATRLLDPTCNALCYRLSKTSFETTLGGVAPYYDCSQIPVVRLPGGILPHADYRDSPDR